MSGTARMSAGVRRLTLRGLAESITGREQRVSHVRFTPIARAGDLIRRLSRAAKEHASKRRRTGPALATARTSARVVRSRRRGRVVDGDLLARVVGSEVY